MEILSVKDKMVTQTDMKTGLTLSRGGKSQGKMQDFEEFNDGELQQVKSIDLDPNNGEVC